MKIKRVFDVLFKEGLYTFQYLVRDNLSEKRSDEEKYSNYIKKYEKLAKNTPGVEHSIFGIIIWDDYGQNFTYKSILWANSGIEVQLLNEDNSLSDAISKLDCDYIGFMTPKDELDRNAYLIISDHIAANNDCICFYSDEDMLDADEKRYNPVFKPDFSFDTLMSFNYIGGFFAVKKDILLSIMNEINSTDIVAEYMILLQIANRFNRNQITHIDKVLLHRKKPLEYSEEMLLQLASFKEKIMYERMLENDLKGVAYVEKNEKYPVHYTYLKLQEKPQISIIIPSKDNPELLRKCLESLCRYTTFSNYEVIVVDNGSNDENREAYNKLFYELPISVKYIYESMEFNFSKMCNIGAHNSNGELLLFLNDDIEILPSEFTEKYQIDWLEVMAANALDRRTGAVGIKLYYPDSTLIQHTGIVNFESGAAHIFSKMNDKDDFPSYRNVATYNYLCVTGACLMVSRAKFDLIGGFEEKLAVTFNDVELCMKLYEAGFDNLVRNDIAFYHHESVTRGEDVLDEQKFHRHLLERELLFDLHPNLVKYDPYYSSYLNQKRLDHSLSVSHYVNRIADKLDMDIYRKCDRNPGKICGKMRSAVMRENLEIQGFVYVEGVRSGMNYLNPCVRISTKDEEIYYEAHKVYDPTMSKYIVTKDNLNFASFYCCIDIEKAGINDGTDFDITLCVRKGKKIYLSDIVRKY